MELIQIQVFNVIYKILRKKETINICLIKNNQYLCFFLRIMTKLLSEPRVPKPIEPKKRVKKVKVEKSLDSEPVKYTLIKESDKTKVNELFRIYKDDPYKARVKYFKSHDSYTFDRLVLFEFDKEHFEICMFETKVGISVTNRIYSSQKKMAAVAYKKGKFWCFKRNGRRGNLNVRPLLYCSLINFIREHETKNWSSENGYLNSFIFNYFKDRFFWVKALSESKFSDTINLNNIKKEKLFGLNDIDRYQFKVPNNIVKVIKASNLNDTLRNNGKSLQRTWPSILKVLDNVQNLKVGTLNYKDFYDTYVMANILGRKINCDWGLKRLVEAHDSWSTEITNILLDCEIEYKLKIRNVYQAFAEFSGFSLLKTNKDMLREGMEKNHCVGTYIDRVEKGECAIYSIDGYTLQLGLVSDIDWETCKARSSSTSPSYFIRETFNIHHLKGLIHDKYKEILHIKQFKGRFNVEAPSELIDLVNASLIKFVNSDGVINSIKELEIFGAKELFEENLPF